VPRGCSSIEPDRWRRTWPRPSRMLGLIRRNELGKLRTIRITTGSSNRRGSDNRYRAAVIGAQTECGGLICGEGRAPPANQGGLVS